ncbi:MAG: hypothetical protein AAFX78_07290 [Cyanobacteria bacterium J06638_20]
MKRSTKNQWLKTIEFIVVNGAILINPEATLLILLLKFCFQVWAALPEETVEKQPSQEVKRHNRKADLDSYVHGNDAPPLV